MKIYYLMLFTFLFSSLFSKAQKLNEMVNLEKYSEWNKQVEKLEQNQRQVVFIGNSITEGWVTAHPDFFTSNYYIGRGIGGQTSPQMLLRFRQDVVDLNPIAVVINAGTNDIAENTGKYNPKFTLDNIKSMSEIALANGISVVLSSVLPVGEYYWRKDIKNTSQLIDELNAKIKEYAKANGFAYIDYNSAMRDDKGALIESYGYDGVHPNEKGYDVMEVVAKKILDQVLTQNDSLDN